MCVFFDLFTSCNCLSVICRIKAHALAQRNEKPYQELMERAKMRSLVSHQETLSKVATSLSSGLRRRPHEAGGSAVSPQADDPIVIPQVNRGEEDYEDIEKGALELVRKRQQDLKRKEQEDAAKAREQSQRQPIEPPRSTKLSSEIKSRWIGDADDYDSSDDPDAWDQNAMDPMAAPAPAKSQTQPRQTRALEGDQDEYGDDEGDLETKQDEPAQPKEMWSLESGSAFAAGPSSSHFSSTGFKPLAGFSGFQPSSNSFGPSGGANLFGPGAPLSGGSFFASSAPTSTGHNALEERFRAMQVQSGESGGDYTRPALHIPNFGSAPGSAATAPISAITPRMDPSTTQAIQKFLDGSSGADPRPWRSGGKDTQYGKNKKDAKSGSLRQDPGSTRIKKHGASRGGFSSDDEHRGGVQKYKPQQSRLSEVSEKPQSFTASSTSSRSSLPPFGGWTAGASSEDAGASSSSAPAVAPPNTNPFVRPGLAPPAMEVVDAVQSFLGKGGAGAPDPRPWRSGGKEVKYASASKKPKSGPAPPHAAPTQSGAPRTSFSASASGADALSFTGLRRRPNEAPDTAAAGMFGSSKGGSSSAPSLPASSSSSSSRPGAGPAPDPQAVMLALAGKVRDPRPWRTGEKTTMKRGGKR
jgi:hypothetical protein